MKAARALLLAPAIWAAHFMLVYATESLACRTGAGGLHRVLVALATLAAVAALAPTLRPGLRRLAGSDADPTMAGFHATAALTLAFLSLLAILWTALPALIVPSCLAPA